MGRSGAVIFEVRGDCSELLFEQPPELGDKLQVDARPCPRQALRLVED